MRIIFTGLVIIATFCFSMAAIAPLMVALRTADDNVILLVFPLLLVPVALPILAGTLSWRWLNHAP